MHTAPNLHQIESLLVRVSFYEAAELARSGNYIAAEAILQELLLSANPPSPVLDLQARICAQQGRLAEASEFWRKALQKDPANVAYQAALARLSRMQRHPMWLHTVWPLVLCLGIVACGTIGLSWLAHHQSSASTQLQRQVVDAVQAESRTTLQQIQNLMATVQILSSNQVAMDKGQFAKGATVANLDGSNSVLGAFSEQLKELHSEALHMATEQKLFAQSSSNQIADLRLTADRDHSLATDLEHQRAVNAKLVADYDALFTNHDKLVAKLGLMTNPPSLSNMPTGVTSSVEGKSVLLTFDEGLFDHGTHFKVGAKSRIQALAKSLAQAREPLQIEVIGYADDDRAFLQWTAKWESSLALERATAVVDYFIELGLFRPANTSAVSGDSRSRPFPSDSIQNRSKNRTIVIRVERDTVAR